MNTGTGLARCNHSSCGFQRTKSTVLLTYSVNMFVNMRLQQSVSDKSSGCRPQLQSILLCTATVYLPQSNMVYSWLKAARGSEFCGSTPTVRAARSKSFKMEDHLWISLWAKTCMHFCLHALLNAHSTAWLRCIKSVRVISKCLYVQYYPRSAHFCCCWSKSMVTPLKYACSICKETSVACEIVAVEMLVRMHLHCLFAWCFMYWMELTVVNTHILHRTTSAGSTSKQQHTPQIGSSHVLTVHRKLHYKHELQCTSREHNLPD